MNNTKKIRLILVNNLTASLFMVSWFKQNKYNEDSEWETIAIYSCIDFKDDYSQNIEVKKKMYAEANFNVFKEYINKWYVCLPDEYDSYEFNCLRLNEAWRERQKRKNDFLKIDGFFSQAQIKPEYVVEIWSANTPFVHHYKYLCKNAKFVFFEHGLSDVRYIISKGIDCNIPRQPCDNMGSHLKQRKFPSVPYFYRYVKNKLKEMHYKLNDFFEEKIIFFKKKTLKYDVYISLLAQEIKTVLTKPITVKTVDSQIVYKTAENIIQSDPIYAEFCSLEGSSALILLESAKPFASITDKGEYAKYFKNFEQYFFMKILPLLKKENIKNVFFKSRFFHEENTKEGFDKFNFLKKHSDGLKIFFLSDYSPLNYPAEFYLSILRPRILIGAYSSALFYAKKMLPSLSIYSYDKWFISYCMQTFNRCFEDYYWLRPFFESDELKAFKFLIPEDI